TRILEEPPLGIVRTEDIREREQTTADVRRPESGDELLIATETGLGSLKVRNGTSPDAVVVLCEGDLQRRAVYIREHDVATLPKIARGSYVLRFVSGKSWNGSEFLTSASYSEFDRP